MIGDKKVTAEKSPGGRSFPLRFHQKTPTAQKIPAGVPRWCRAFDGRPAELVISGILKETKCITRGVNEKTVSWMSQEVSKWLVSKWINNILMNGVYWGCNLLGINGLFWFW